MSTFRLIESGMFKVMSIRYTRPLANFIILRDEKHRGQRHKKWTRYRCYWRLSPRGGATNIMT